MNFEFDLKKSLTNQQKHGISLEEAQSLWDVPGVTIRARTEDEPRCMRVASYREKFYSCIYTLRDDVIRLISVRRSRIEEEKIYWEVMKYEKGK